MGDLAQRVHTITASAPSLAWLTVVSVIAPLALMILLIGLAIVKGPGPRRDQTAERPDDPPHAE